MFYVLVGRGVEEGLPGLYVEPGKYVAGSGGQGDVCLLHHAGLLNPPDKHWMVYIPVRRGVDEGYLVCTLSPGKTLPGAAGRVTTVCGTPQPARQTLDVLCSGWERG